jgi:biopolymer transport protein ExbD
MNKTILFLMVVVVVARGAIYIYEKNKTEIDKIVSKPDATGTKDSVNMDRPVPVATETPVENISPFTLTFLLSGNNEVYYYGGEFSGTLNTLNYSTLGIFIKAYKDAVDPADLMFIIKADKTASYKNMIEVLDIMQKNEVPKGRYVEQEISEEEASKLKLLKESKNG